MGCRYTAICRKCMTRFDVSDGGGFRFHMLHCNKCGQEKAVGFDELGDIHAAYLKGLCGPYTIAPPGSDQEVGQTFAGEAITEKEYYAKVESFAGKCACGGRFTFRASARCPQCRSRSFTEDPTGDCLYYD